MLSNLEAYFYTYKTEKNYVLIMYCLDHESALMFMPVHWIIMLSSLIVSCQPLISLLAFLKLLNNIVIVTLYRYNPVALWARGSTSFDPKNTLNVMYPIIIKNLAMVTGGISFISNTCTHKERKKQVRVRQKDKQNSKEKKIIKSRRKE